MKLMRIFLIFITVLSFILDACSGVKSKDTSDTTSEEVLTMNVTEFNNYSGLQADDPYITRDGTIWYYCKATENRILVASMHSPAAAAEADFIEIYSGKDNDYTSIWAPELIKIDGTWYIYTAMSPGEGLNENHRMYVLRCTGSVPTEPFELVGQLTDSTDKWAIDGTVFEYNENLYTIWSGWPGNVDSVQNLYIAHMSDPLTIDSERILISTPDSWDSLTTNPKVNEGPCVICNDGKLYCLYSGNGSWTDEYAIGVLTLDGDNPLDSSSWIKSETPLISKQAGFFGPGHCSITTDASDTMLVVFHANLNEGQGWDGRSLRIVPLTINGDTLSVTGRLPGKVQIAGYELK